MSENLKQMDPDRNAKGYRVGRKHHNAKYTDEQVSEVRRMYAQGMARRDISNATGVGIESVRKFANGQRRAQAASGQAAPGASVAEQVIAGASRKRDSVAKKLQDLKELRKRLETIDGEIAQAEAAIRFLDAVMQVSV